MEEKKQVPHLNIFLLCADGFGRPVTDGWRQDCLVTKGILNNIRINKLHLFNLYLGLSTGRNM